VRGEERKKKEKIGLCVDWPKWERAAVGIIGAGGEQWRHCITSHGDPGLSISDFTVPLCLMILRYVSMTSPYHLAWSSCATYQLCHLITLPAGPAMPPHHLEWWSWATCLCPSLSTRSNPGLHISDVPLIPSPRYHGLRIGNVILPPFLVIQDYVSLKSPHQLSSSGAAHHCCLRITTHADTRFSISDVTLNRRPLWAKICFHNISMLVINDTRCLGSWSSLSKRNWKPFLSLPSSPNSVKRPPPSCSLSI
jgi:hypothetical protein